MRPVKGRKVYVDESEDEEDDNLKAPTPKKMKEAVSDNVYFRILYMIFIINYIF
jgi:hypothetical protein